jgi:hypothetical protein
MSKEMEIMEAPGLYGHFSVKERLIQQIWEKGDFMADDLRTLENKKLNIIDSGKWNLAEEGPDFKGARISIDGQNIEGDVEIHFNEKDWIKHGHDEDPAFARVSLHVVLYPIEEKTRVVFADRKRKIHTLVLLPYLFKSLEEYAEEDALEKLAGISPQSTIPDHFPKNLEECKDWARKRWIQKCKHAENRLNSANWEDACHQWFLEVLGYRRNRTPMARIAQLFPVKTWRAGLNENEVYNTQKDWKLRGCRPANHPKKRLHQYAHLSKRFSGWMISMQKMDFSKDSSIEALRLISRKTLQLKKREDEWAQNILGGVFGGTRLHTLMVDACLPLWSVYNGKSIFETWYHWSSGDVPAVFRQWSQQANLNNRSQPFCNGMAQAILWGRLKQ